MESIDYFYLYNLIFYMQVSMATQGFNYFYLFIEVKDRCPYFPLYREFKILIYLNSIFT